MAPKKDENVRHFKVVEVNGKLMEMGRYKGTIPIQAAKKAFKSICEKVGKKGSCALTFTLKETTNGSPKDVHGPYVGEKIKKKKPVVVEFKDKSGKVTKISYKYDYVVYLKKEIMKGGFTATRTSSGETLAVGSWRKRLANAINSISPTDFKLGSSITIKNSKGRFITGETLYNLFEDEVFNSPDGQLEKGMEKFDALIKLKRNALKQQQVFVMTVGQPMLEEILFGDNVNLKTKIMALRINALKELIDNVVYLSNDVITQKINNVKISTAIDAEIQNNFEKKRAMKELSHIINNENVDEIINQFFTDNDMKKNFKNYYNAWNREAIIAYIGKNYINIFNNKYGIITRYNELNIYEKKQFDIVFKHTGFNYELNLDNPDVATDAAADPSGTGNPAARPDPNPPAAPSSTPPALPSRTAPALPSRTAPDLSSPTAAPAEIRIPSSPIRGIPAGTDAAAAAEPEAASPSTPPPPPPTTASPRKRAKNALIRRGNPNPSNTDVTEEVKRRNTAIKELKVLNINNPNNKQIEAYLKSTRRIASGGKRRKNRKH